MLLSAYRHLLEQVAEVPAIEIEPRLELTPDTGRSGLPAPHVGVERHGPAGSSRMPQEVRRDAQGVGQPVEYFGLRFAQVVLIARERGLCDTGLLSQIRLGESLGSAGCLQDLAE